MLLMLFGRFPWRLCLILFELLLMLLIRLRLDGLFRVVNLLMLLFGLWLLVVGLLRIRLFIGFGLMFGKFRILL